MSDFLSTWSARRPALLDAAAFSPAFYDAARLLSAAKRVSAHHVELSVEAPQLWLMFFSNQQMLPRTIHGSAISDEDTTFSGYLDRLSELLGSKSCVLQVTSLAQFGGFPLWQALSGLLGPIIERDGPIRKSSLSLFIGRDSTITSLFLGDRFSDPDSLKMKVEEPHLLLNMVEGSCVVVVDGEETTLRAGSSYYVPLGAERSVRLDEFGVVLCLAVSSSFMEKDDADLISKAAISFGRNLLDDKVSHEVVRIDEPVTGPPASFETALASARTFSSGLLDLVAQEWLKQQITLGFESPPPRDKERSLEDCESVTITGGVPIRWCSTSETLLVGIGGRVMQIQFEPVIERAILTLNTGEPVNVEELVESASDEDLDEVVYDFLQNLLSFHAIEDAGA